VIEIIYDKEKELIFELSYNLHEYIPDSIFQKYPQNTELHYLHELFTVDSYIQFKGEFPMIWSTHYLYECGHKGFIVVLDEDYDIISYAVQNPIDRKEIAEYISKLIVDRIQ